MPEIQVSTKEYQDLMKKRSKYDIHFEIQLMPKFALNSLANQGYIQPKSLLCYLFANSTIKNNEIISTIDFGDLTQYFKMQTEKDTRAKLLQSFQPLIDNGIAKVSNKLLNLLEPKSSIF